MKENIPKPILCLCIFYNYSMNIARQCKTQNHAVEDKYSILWEWSEYNMIFTSLKWNISAKSFPSLQSAFSDQNVLPAQNYEDRYANCIWRPEQNQNKKHKKNERCLFLYSHNRDAKAFLILYESADPLKWRELHPCTLAASQKKISFSSWVKQNSPRSTSRMSLSSYNMLWPGAALAQQTAHLGRKGEFSEHLLRMTQKEILLLYVWMGAGMRSG